MRARSRAGLHAPTRTDSPARARTPHLDHTPLILTCARQRFDSPPLSGDTRHNTPISRLRYRDGQYSRTKLALTYSISISPSPSPSPSPGYGTQSNDISYFADGSTSADDARLNGSWTNREARHLPAQEPFVDERSRPSTTSPGGISPTVAPSPQSVSPPVIRQVTESYGTIPKLSMTVGFGYMLGTWTTVCSAMPV